MYFVCVEFSEDNERQVTMFAYVKIFEPAHYADFEEDKTYSAFWTGNSTTRGRFYDQKILHMVGKDECFHILK